MNTKCSIFLEGTTVLCLDGKIGMIIRVPIESCKEYGVQVPGEENIRWIKQDKIIDSNGFIIESS
jgi:hypothetical protein